MVAVAPAHTTALTSDRTWILDDLEEHGNHGMPDDYTESIAWLAGEGCNFTVVRRAEPCKSMWDGTQVVRTPTIWGLTYVTVDGLHALADTFLNYDLAEESAYADNLIAYNEHLGDRDDDGGE